MQMIERRPGRLQPVLEHRHILRIPVPLIQILDGFHRELNKPEMLRYAQIARSRKIRPIRRRIREMPPPNNQVMPPSKETLRLLQQLFIRHILRAQPSRGPLRANGAQHMLPAQIRGNIVIHALPGHGIHLKTIVGFPILIGDNLKQVRHPPKHGLIAAERLRLQTGNYLIATFTGHQPRLFRRGIQLTILTKRTKIIPIPRC